MTMVRSRDHEDHDSGTERHHPLFFQPVRSNHFAHDSVQADNQTPGILRDRWECREKSRIVSFGPITIFLTDNSHNDRGEPKKFSLKLLDALDLTAHNM
jgi:hypothetical protein